MKTHKCRKILSKSRTIHCISKFDATVNLVYFESSIKRLWKIVAVCMFNEYSASFGLSSDQAQISMTSSTCSIFDFRKLYLDWYLPVLLSPKLR